MRKLFSRTDIFIIIGVIVLSFIFLIPNFFKNDELIAQVYADGEIVKEFNLSEIEEETVFCPNENVVISVRNGAIRFSSSSCKDELCVNSGWLTAKGQTAACLPQKVVITIKGAGKTDMITY